MKHLVDVHAHLDRIKELNKVIDRAKQTGVSVIITNGINLETNNLSLEYAKKYKIVKAALGLYPTEALKVDVDEVLKQVQNNKDKIIAVGEVGLDYHWIKDKNKEQQEVFQRIIKLAENIKKPIIVHSREAEEDVINMLESSKLKKIVMHCFGGKLKLSKKIADNGWSLSIPTNVARSKHFQRIIEEVNINQLFSETDSPYLGPVPDRDNEPANVIEVVKKISEIKGFTEEDTAGSLFMNYQRMFL